MKLNLSATLTIVTVLGFAASSAYSHSVVSTSKVMATEVLPPSAKNASNTAQAGGMNAVVNAYKLWRAGSTLNVCFWQGTDATERRFFVDSEREWEQYADLKWDFGPGPNYRTCGSSPSHIRIGFDHVGHWSYVGTDAIRPDLVSHPSLNIDMSSFGAWQLADKSQIRGVILHEVGHAFGLEHEHQSPKDTCIASIRWDVVYAEMGKPPNSWDHQKIDVNFKALVDTARLRTTDYDRLSIMHYSFPARWFGNPSCAVTQSLDLSATDKQEIALAYPQNKDEQQQFVNNVNSRTSGIVDNLNLTKAQRDRLAEDIKTIPQRLDKTLSNMTAIQIIDNSTNNGVIQNGQITIGDVTISNVTTRGSCAGVTGVQLGTANSNCR